MRVSLGGWSFELDGMSAFDEPDPNTDVISLFLEDGVPFEKGPYLDMNYTRYEVWIVGAAGGRGGAILRSFDPFNRKSIWGGAGGGGGLHRVSGMLAALPDSVDVSIGVAGADGQDGSGDIWDWDFTSNPEYLPYPMLPDRDGSGNIIMPLHFHPNPLWVEPLAGEDGEASSFGSIGKASGGTGGAPVAPKEGGAWSDWYLSAGLTYVGFDDLRPGYGGDGGLGNSLVAGGGGAGGVPKNLPFLTKAIPAEDGKWNGSIGSGGGGGYGGIFKGVLTEGSPPDAVSPLQYVYTDAGNGGRGSYSFRDPSVFGPRERDYAQTPFAPALGDAGSGGHRTVPGSGGGARLNPLNQQHRGSKNPEANPNGGVFIRIFDIELPV